MTEEPGFPKSKEELERRLDKRRASTLEELIGRFQAWLYMEPRDVEFVEVGLAAALDREIPGDPVWLFMVAPSGAMKTEFLRSLREYGKAYTLDSLTPKTLVSGLTRVDKETGEPKPVGGILRDLNGKVLILKDFTTMLSKAEEERTAIYGQLRAAYDGFFEKAFGTMREPIRIRSTFGLVAGVTPAISRYTRMASALGERFLMVRSSPDRKKAATKAMENVGREAEMRAQLQGSVSSFLQSLSFDDVPTLTDAQEDEIIKVAVYVAIMRSRPWVRYYQGAITTLEVDEPEVPTRAAKQLAKLVKLLAILRGHTQVEEADMDTVRRVARDTVVQRRQRIIDAFRGVGWDQWLSVSDIAGRSGLHHQTTQNETTIIRPAPRKSPIIGCSSFISASRFMM